MDEELSAIQGIVFSVVTGAMLWLLILAAALR